MDSVPPKEKDNEDHSALLASVAPTKLSLTSCALRTQIEGPKEAKSAGSPELYPDARNLSKENNLETTIPGCQNRWTARSKRDHKPALYNTSGKSTEKSCKPNRVQKSSLGQHGSKASQSIISASFKKKALSKAMKLGPITYRGALKMTEQVCKTQLHLLKHHLKDRSDLFTDGDTLLHEFANMHPKYNQLIRTLPILLNFFPGELKEKLMIEENVELWKMGAYLVNKWITRSA